MRTLMRYAAALAVFSLVMMPAMARAGGCGSYSGYSYGGYNYGSYSNYYSYYRVDPLLVVIPKVFFQFAAPTVVAPTATVAATATPAATKAPARSAVTTRADAVDKLIAERFEAFLKKNMGAPEDDGPPLVGNLGTEAPSTAGNPVSDDMRLITVLAVKCSSCHSATAKKGGIVLFDSNGQFNANIGWDRIAAAVGAVHGKPVIMPPGAKGNPNSPEAVPADVVGMLQRKVSVR